MFQQPRLLACLLVLTCLTGQAFNVRAGETAQTVTVFAAASVKPVMDAIVPDFEAATGHRVTVALAGSSVLARQIQAGAPADIFISANRAWMDVLEGDGLIDSTTRFDLAGNRLVMVAHGAAPPLDLTNAQQVVARLGGGRLAVALTRAVPAGIYAEAALRSLGLWDSVAKRLAETDNVRAALALVALGEAPMGVVYATDAAAEPRVSIIGEFPAGSHPAIAYPVARIAGHGGPAAAGFLGWLKGPATRAALLRQGFIAPPAAGD